MEAEEEILMTIDEVESSPLTLTKSLIKEDNELVKRNNNKVFEL